ncbi:folate-binding protein [Breoghania sp.]|uniref:CAF17-like 4Fe-4S cluster assembly/insertion protein YgfZ n=1 Tax=Breoghania sp. TaxID=2065378 RepID=UPI002609DD32|nr:folate-binding protein [Breoghania sp.]MDJ0932391.1 folate-binding protein [Breoghania sp.]
MSAFLSPLPSRAVVRISGEGAEHFLQGLITCDVEKLEEGAARYGGLLTPQGKILSDFLVQRREDGFWFDLPSALAADFIKRMTLYKLRAKVEIANLSDSHQVLALWSTTGEMTLPDGAFADPRHAGLGGRLIAGRDAALPDGFAEADEAAWEAHRIALTVPEGGADFEYGQAFPHDADMDQLSGVALDKGCFVGQEVVSRMRHRGTARKRIIAVRAHDDLPETGSEITAGGKAAGTLGSVSGGAGLALVRIDRLGAAVKDGVPITAGDVAITPHIPDWAQFDWPADAAGNETGA